MNITELNLLISVCAGVGILFLWIAFFWEEKNLLAKTDEGIQWDAETVIEDKDSAIIGQVILPLAQSLVRYTSDSVPKEKLEKIRVELLAAGNPYNLKPIEFYNFRFAFGIAGLGLGLVLGYMFTDDLQMAGMAMVVAGIAGMLFGPSQFLGGIRKKREAEIRRALPNYLNLLAVSLRSGQDFISAVKVINSYEKGLLVKEMDLMVQGVEQGETISTAMQTLNNRCKVPSIAEFYHTIRNVEKFGQMGLVSKKIESLSKDIQEEVFNHVKKQAANVESQIYLPAGLVFFAVLIVAGAPLAINMMSGFGF